MVPGKDAACCMRLYMLDAGLSKAECLPPCRAASASLTRRQSVESPFARYAAAHIKQMQSPGGLDSAADRPSGQQAPPERPQPVRQSPRGMQRHLTGCSSRHDVLPCKLYAWLSVMWRPFCALSLRRRSCACCRGARHLLLAPSGPRGPSQRNPQLRPHRSINCPGPQLLSGSSAHRLERPLRRGSSRRTRAGAPLRSTDRLPPHCRGRPPRQCP